MSSLRDRRWVNRFMFSYTDLLFYEPFEKKYKAGKEFILLVREKLPKEWSLEREGLWVYVTPPTYTFPPQGWKIHISATPYNAISILKHSTEVLISQDTAFKFIVDSKVFQLINDKNWSRGSSGKFITVYPKDEEHFKQVIEALYKVLKNEKGPYILSDKRYKDCKVLYYRYGGIERLYRLNILGIKELGILTPKGEFYKDERKPYYDPPPWVEDPFSFDDEEPPLDDLFLKDGRYLIKSALHFSNSGGVYLAEDRFEGVDVVIKEARPYTSYTAEGEDAVTRLRKEFSVLKEIEAWGFTPKPIDLFQDWEHLFLVEEYIEGKDLRVVSLENSPLIKTKPRFDDSERFLEIFKKIFTQVVIFLRRFHKAGYVFGDLSPVNILIENNYGVRIIDLESAFKKGSRPTFLSTPSFSSEDFSQRGDLMALGAIMMYFIMPILAVRDIKKDIFYGPLDEMIDDLGWSREIAQMIRKTAEGVATYDYILEVLRKAEVERSPNFKTKPYTQDHLKDFTDKMYDFLLSAMRYEEDILIPTDPFAYLTNGLSLGFGAAGVLYAIKKSGYEIPKKALRWFTDRVVRINSEDFPPGLLTGLAGISWVSWELGYHDLAEKSLKLANSHRLLFEHPSYYYGAAGVGLANLFLYLKTQKDNYLSEAIRIADVLLSSAHGDKIGLHWKYDGTTYIGLGYGQSGIAIFFLRLYQITGNKKFLHAGRRALEYDLSTGKEIEEGVISYKESLDDVTVEPYVEVGTAGIIKVALRYGLDVDNLIPDIVRKYAVFPSLIFGLSGLVDTLVDLSIYRKNKNYIYMTNIPLSGIMSLFPINVDGKLAFPGEGLFRVSCDYATGVAGIMRTFYRLIHRDRADFMLDEVENE